MDTFKIEVSYIESGGPSFDGSYTIENDTLTLILKDKIPNISCSSEEFLKASFTIKLHQRSFKNIKLTRNYGFRTVTNYCDYERSQLIK